MLFRSDDKEFKNGFTIRDVAQHLVNELEEQIYPVDDPCKYLNESVLPNLIKTGTLIVMFVPDLNLYRDFLQAQETEFPLVIRVYLSNTRAYGIAAVLNSLETIEENKPLEYSIK